MALTAQSDADVRSGVQLSSHFILKGMRRSQSLFHSHKDTLQNNIKCIH